MYLSWCKIYLFRAFAQFNGVLQRQLTGHICLCFPECSPMRFIHIMEGTFTLLSFLLWSRLAKSPVIVVQVEDHLRVAIPAAIVARIAPRHLIFWGSGGLLSRSHSSYHPKRMPFSAKYPTIQARNIRIAKCQPEIL